MLASANTFTAMFQSSPTSKGGRYLKVALSPAKSLGVSILAHLERWALQYHKVGDKYELDVSILAHLERWALPRNAVTPVWSLRVSILAHLERWALQGKYGEVIDYCLFQSSPTSKGGRYLRVHIQDVLLDLFQSSPTSKGGRY